MTRARDHLVVCLHHKELNQPSATPTIAARLHEICLRFPALWRRLPIAALTATGPEAEEAPTAALAMVRAGFGLDPPGGTGPDLPPGGPGADADAWRQGIEAFVARRAHALASARRAPVTTATAVSDSLARTDASTTDRRAPGPTPDPGSPDSTGALWRDADTSLQIGRAVHSALAAIDLATACDDAGLPAPEVARGRATAHGVDAHADDIVAMVSAALASPSVAAGSGRRHWRELFVAVPVGPGVLEGFVDLVVEDDDGLVVIDYKTDRTGGGAAIAGAASRYGPQVASYALALEQSTGRPVHRCVLVFLGEGAPVEVVLEGDALADACDVARRAADELLSVGTG